MQRSNDDCGKREIYSEDSCVGRVNTCRIRVGHCHYARHDVRFTMVLRMYDGR